MTPTKPKTKSRSKVASSQATKSSKLIRVIRGFPGTAEERAAQRRRFAKKHRETLLRLGK